MTKLANCIMFFTMLLCLVLSWPINASESLNSPSRFIASRVTFNLDELVDQHLVDYLQILQELDVKFPAEKFHLVIMGRSLTMLAGILDAQGIRSFSALPLSGLSDYIFAYSSDLIRYRRDKTIQNLENFYFPHFRQYMPTNLGGKKIVVIDFIASGSSLYNAQVLLTQYYNQLGLPGIVHSIAVKYKNEEVSPYGTKNIDHPPFYLNVSYSLATSLADNQMKEYSNIPQLYPFSEPIHPARAQKYKQLITTIKNKMATLTPETLALKCANVFQIASQGEN